MRLKGSIPNPVSELLDWDKHPIKVVEEIINHYGRDIKFEFSRYKYIPQHIEDTQEVFYVDGNSFSQDYISNLIADLGDDEELALHSRIIIDNKLKHIPMIDLSTKSTARTVKELVNLLPMNTVTQLALYNSGRFYHAYSTCLIDNESFPSFLGQLLLFNRPGEPLLVDSRWVGHRLVDGYLSLRWSCNSSGYIHYPQKITDISI